MASIINAVRNIISDNWWIVKVIVFAAPIFLIINNKIFDGFGETNKIIAYIILACLYFGICSFLINRNINNLTPILPSLFTLLDWIKRSIFVSIVTIPLYLLYFYVINYVSQVFSSQPIVMYIIIVCVTMFLAPFIILPTIYYSVRDSLLDALNFKLIIDGSGNFAVAFLTFLIQYLIIFGVIGYSVYKLLTEMINDSLLLNIAISIFIVLSILTLYSYCSDLYPETIPEIQGKKKKSKR